MKSIYILFCFLVSISAFGQKSIDAIFLQKSEFPVTTIVAMDNFGTQYHLDYDILYKKEPKNTTSYSNVQLGKITSANAFNPLKIKPCEKNLN